MDVDKIVLDKIKNEGIDKGLEMIEYFFQKKKLSAGKLSTIGYTLNDWKMYNEASAVFHKRGEYYPEKLTTWNQLGITNLFREDFQKSRLNFMTVLDNDSTHSRALEYIKLIDLLNK